MPTLPTWEELTDLDKGAALIYLAKAYDEPSYARKHYPPRYLDHPALTALSRRDACDHADGLFDDGIDTAVDQLGEDEIDRLCDLAMAATR
jgi:hypothetical protein